LLPKTALKEAKKIDCHWLRLLRKWESIVKDGNCNGIAAKDSFEGSQKFDCQWWRTRKSEGEKHPSGEGWFSRYDATAMLSMRPCTALQADATSVDPRKWSDTTRRWISMSMLSAFRRNALTADQQFTMLTSYPLTTSCDKSGSFLGKR
jgi:hypothetical protein